MNLIPTDVPNLCKSSSGAVVNRDAAALSAYQKRASLVKGNQASLETRINSLEQKIELILQLLTEKGK